MVSLKNIKTNRPKRKQDNNQNRPWPVLTAYRGAVVVDLLDYIYVNKSFYTLKVRLQFPKKIPSQVYINKEERYNIIGRIAKRDNNSNITDKWCYGRFKYNVITTQRGVGRSQLVNTGTGQDGSRGTI